MNTIARIFLFLITLMLASCGGGGIDIKCTEAPPRVFTTAQIQTLTPTDIKTVRDDELISFGTDIQYLSNSTIAALTNTVVNTNFWCMPHAAQIESITPTQIAVLSPAQIRFLGADANAGVAQIKGLTNATFTQLVSSTAQVAALLVPEVATLPSEKFVLIGDNFPVLTDTVLASLKETYNATPNNLMSHIRAITPSQIATLTPARVQILGSAETGVPKISFLADNTFARLVSDPAQVAAFTTQEIAALNSSQFAMIGSNFGQLSDTILSSLKYTYIATPTNSTSQIGGISPSQILSLAPAKVRILGAYDNGISKINYLSPNTFIALASDPLQVAAITPAEIGTFFTSNIKNLGLNIHYLSNAAYQCAISMSNPQCQVASIDYAQTPTFSQSQIMIIAALNSGKGIAFMSDLGFGGLTATQVTGLLPAHVVAVNASQLAALSNETLAAFLQATRDSFTSAQKALLSASQRTACGC